jgi:hypothetical protein
MRWALTHPALPTATLLPSPPPNALIRPNTSSAHCIHLPTVKLFLYDVRDIHRRFNNLRVDWT